MAEALKPENRSGTPRVTVATVVFEGAASLTRTLDSTLSQDYPNLEIVVIDGGSADGTIDIVRRFGDRIDTFVSEPDHGIYDAMNKAVGRATGDFLLFMNCGDTFAGTDALGAAVRALLPGEEQAVFGAWERVEAGGARHPRRPSLERGLFNHQAILYSRSLHDRFGGYVAVAGFSTADYFFFMTIVMSRSVRCTCIDAPIAVIDVSGVSAGPQTLSQKFAIDFLLGRANRAQLLMVLIGHPSYRRAKALLKRLR
ncbi:MAG: glycosyltransferase family 2 protein [Caldimonas sp.]